MKEILLAIKPSGFGEEMIIKDEIVEKIVGLGDFVGIKTFESVPKEIVSKLYKGNKWHDNCVKNLTGHKMVFIAVRLWEEVTFKKLEEIKKDLRNKIKHGPNSSDNVIHISDGLESGKREVKIFFNDEEK